jgi:general secretion pathway protein I
MLRLAGNSMESDAPQTGALLALGRRVAGAFPARFRRVLDAQLTRNWRATGASAALTRRLPAASAPKGAETVNFVNQHPLAGSNDDGFSLIEALVALAVLAIATVGLIRAVETHIDSTRAMERRAAAMWVAENRLAEIQLADPAAGNAETELLGQQWRVAVARTRTEDAAIDKVRIQVFAQGAERTPLASLDGFVEGSGT